MKTTFTSLLWFLLGPSGNTPQLEFDIHRIYDRPVVQEKLMTARTLSDFCEGYPKSWITDCISSEISTTTNGKVLKAKGLNDTLNGEQRKLIQSADLGTGIEITVQYQFLNPVTNAISKNRMNFTIAVVPDTEASFPDGYQKLKTYLAENGIEKIPAANRPEIKPVKVYFTVNEEGSIVNEYLSKTSGDPKTDKILLEVIQKMPKWKPAHNRSGANVRQEFVFAVGNVGC